MSADSHPAMPEFEADLARIHSAAMFLTSPMLVARLEEALSRAVQQAESPFVDREAAAARWYCSVSEIDRASRTTPKILTPHYRGDSPLFLKAEGDQAILEGRWVPAVRRKLASGGSQAKVFKKAA